MVDPKSPPSPESSNQPEPDSDRVAGFDEIIEWARSNGWTDFDFEGLERRIVEIASVMREASADESPDAPPAPPPKPAKLVPFVRKLPKRGQRDV